MTGGTLATGLQTKVLNMPAGGGWAVVALCSMTTTWKASTLVTMVSGASVNSVVAWSASTDSWQTYIPGYPFNDFSIVPGQAYWVFLTGTGVLSYNP